MMMELLAKGFASYEGRPAHSNGRRPGATSISAGSAASQMPTAACWSSGGTTKASPWVLANARKLLEDLPNKVRDVLGIMVDVNLVKKTGKELIEIRVEAYPSPISYKGEYHYRSGSTKQELKGAALERFLLKKRGRHWDGVPEPSFSANACSAAAMRLFKQKATRERAHGSRRITRQP